MKLVTNDYGCGTSSSILDYNIEDVVIVSETNYSHIFDVEDDLLFIGHDFLFYLWDNEEKIKRWHLRKGKWEHWVWAFERIDAIVPAWQQKSHYSIAIAQTFCNRVLACDEDDCDKYGFDWLPQWASRKFFDIKATTAHSSKIIFSGQAGKPEYKLRTDLLNNITSDQDVRDDLVISNLTRNLDWDSYVKNLTNYSRALNPVGILKGFNTRSYEVIYSGGLLLQQTIGTYKRHEKLFEEIENVFFFEDFLQLKDKIVSSREFKKKEGLLLGHSLFDRMKLIGVEIK